jgi:glycosyltransferase involved in cell wall biosynthesis
MQGPQPHDTRPELSVVLPTRNGQAYLEAQLEAIAHQDCSTDWEVVVADNESTDSTVAIASTFHESLPELRVIRASPRGKSYALNAGIAVARGKFIVCLDQDDVVAPGYLEAMRTSLGTADVAGGRLEHRSLNPPWAVVTEGQVAALMGAADLLFSSGSALAFRRVVYETVGGFASDVGAGDDADFCWRAQEAGFSIGFVPDAVVRCRHRSSLRATLRQGISYGRGSALVRRKHGVDAVPWAEMRWRMRAVISHALHARDRRRRYRLVYLLGFVVGRYRGAVLPRSRPTGERKTDGTGLIE